MRKKSLLLFLLAVLCLITVSAAVTASAISVEIADASGSCGSSMTWHFEAATGTLTVTGSGTMDAGEHAPWDDLDEYIVSVVIEEGVTSISHGAFSGMQQLTSVDLPESLQRIESNAFSGCWGLSQVVLGSNVNHIGKYAFWDCRSLCSINIPSGVTEISYGAFSDCGFTSLELHNGITSIGGYAFNGCRKLTSVVIPDSVTELGSSSFGSCYHLSDVTLGSSVSDIQGNTFSRCPNLTSIVIPDSVKSIGTNAFTGCSALSDVHIGAGVSEVDITAFDECTNLSAFSVSSSNPYIYADQGVLYQRDTSTLLLMPKGFSGSYQVLPGTVEIGERACYECTGLTAITIPGSVTQINKYAFDFCSGLRSVTLSHGLQRIGMSSFSCSGIEALTIPASVVLIESSAFGYCKSLKKITFLGHAPEIWDPVFSQVEATVYYPGDKATWKHRGNFGGNLTWVSVSCNGNHTAAEDKGYAATCTEDGLSDGSHCSVCGTTLTAQKVIPAGHSFSSWSVITAATLEQEGLSRRSCSVCGHAEDRVLAKLSPPETEPTETEPTGTVPVTTEPSQPTPSIPPETTIPETTSEPPLPSTNPEAPSSDVPTEPTTPSAPTDSNGPPVVIIAVAASMALTACIGIVTIIIRLRKR